MPLYFSFNRKEYIFHVISIVKFSPYIKAERQTLYFCKMKLHTLINFTYKVTNVERNAKVKR